MCSTEYGQELTGILSEVGKRIANIQYADPDVELHPAGRESI
jgi:hypothetical protein